MKNEHREHVNKKQQNKKSLKKHRLHRAKDNKLNELR